MLLFLEPFPRYQLWLGQGGEHAVVTFAKAIRTPCPIRKTGTFLGNLRMPTSASPFLSAAVHLEGDKEIVIYQDDLEGGCLCSVSAACALGV